MYILLLPNADATNAFTAIVLAAALHIMMINIA